MIPQYMFWHNILVTYWNTNYIDSVKYMEYVETK